MLYSHHDRPFAVRLHRALAAAGKDMWLDEEDILPASRWARDLKEAIEGADTFIALISPEWAASGECRKELDHAAALDKRIIPPGSMDAGPREMPDGTSLPSFVILVGRQEGERQVGQLDQRR